MRVVFVYTPLPLCVGGRGVVPTPNTVELISTLGALFPRGGPVQDSVLTRVREAKRRSGRRWHIEEDAKETER